MLGDNSYIHVRYNTHTFPPEVFNNARLLKSE